MDKIWWSMQDLKERTGYSEDWLKENILLHPRYRQMLDLENGGFVYYPEKKGERWCFIASRMEEFLQKYFCDIFMRKETKTNIKTRIAQRASTVHAGCSNDTVTCHSQW